MTDWKVQQLHTYGPAQYALKRAAHKRKCHVLMWPVLKSDIITYYEMDRF